MAKTAKRLKAAPFGNRILKYGERPASEFLANPDNWRIHPKPQQDVMDGILGAVGFVGVVLVNRRTDPSWGTQRGVETMVDGHLRVERALDRDDDTPIPYVEVDLTKEEEAVVLGSFDPIGDLAVADPEKLALVLAEMPDDLRELTAVLRAEKEAVRRVVAFETVERFRVRVDCDSTATQQALIARLTAEGFTCSAE